MRKKPSRTVIGVLASITVLGLVGCASSGSSERAGDQRLPEAQTGIGTMTIDAVSSRFDIRYIEEVSPVKDTVNAIVEEVWNLVPQAYVDLGIPIGGVNPEARLLGNTGFRARGELSGLRLSEVVRCGRTMTGDIADQYDVHLSVLTQVREESGKSVVSSVVDATARPTGVSGNAVRCSSRGRLESEIVKRVRSQLVGIE